MEPYLFLAFKTDNSFDRELEKTNPYLVNLLLYSGDYLVELAVKGGRYFGKHSPPHPTLDQLEDLEKHLISLLNRLTPHYAFSENPPILLAINE